jgi:hypothetical protein
MSLTELKKAAEAATPVPWNAGGYLGMCFTADDAKFIALANPAAILKLIAVVEAAKEAGILYETHLHAGRAFAEFEAALKELES